MGRHEDKCSLIEAPFHGVVKLLTENACGIEGIGTSIWGTWRAYANIRGIVGDGEVERKVIDCLSVLLLWKAVQVIWLRTLGGRAGLPVEANRTQVGCGEGYIWGVNDFYLGS